jgi:hypothetical protein
MNIYFILIDNGNHTKYFFRDVKVLNTKCMKTILICRCIDRYQFIHTFIRTFELKLRKFKLPIINVEKYG